MSRGYASYPGSIRLAPAAATNLATPSDRLRQRALRIVMPLSRCDEQRAAELLAACDGKLSETVARARP